MARKAITKEPDSLYLLKIFLYLILGTIWISHGSNRIVPIGLIAGVIIAQHDRLQLDRKIEYAILLIAAVGGLMGVGITLHL